MLNRQWKARMKSPKLLPYVFLNAKGIEMNIPNQLRQIGIPFTQKGLISILKQVTVAFMAPVKLLNIAG